MELRLALTLALAVIGCVHAVPVQWEGQVTKCSQQCSAPQNFKYQSGKTYVYAYESWTKLHLNGEDGPQVRLTAKADVSVIDDCELALRLRDVNVRGPVDKSDIKAALEAEPLVFSFDDGRVESVCPSPADQRWAVNMKKAVLSSLQVNLKSLSGSQIIREKDVLGDCETTYEVISSQAGTTTIKKSKDMTTCGRAHKAVASIFPRGYLSPDHAIQNLPILSNDYNCQITVARDIVQKSECIDKNTFLPLSWSQAGSSVETSIVLRFESVNAGLSAGRPSSISRQHLLFARNPESSNSDESKVKSLLRDICSQVIDEVKTTVPAKFAELVYALRPLSVSETQRLDEQVNRGDLCNSDKIKDIWADALIMDASEGSIKLIADKIVRKEMSNARANYLLTMLAFANRPTAGAVRALIPLLEQADAPRQAILGTSALIRNLINDQDENRNIAESKEVKDAVSALLKIVRKERSSGNVEKAVVALKALRNIGQIGDAKTLVLEIATDKNAKTNLLRLVAMTVLKEQADQQIRQKMLSILRDQNEESEVRIYAYKVAVEGADRDTVQEIITILKRETSKQVGSYVSSHLENLKESSSPHVKEVREILTQENIPSSRFPSDVRKYSRNFELSYLMERANLGGILDADVIYDKSFAPRIVRLNLTAPLFGKSLNLFEIGVRQVGLENELEALVGPQGALSKKNVPEIVSEIADFFQSSSESNEIGRSANRFRRASRSDKDMELSAWVNFDGKTIAHMDASDADASDMKQVLEAVQQRVAAMAEGFKTDRAFSFMFLDATHEIPSANGLPIKIDLNGTAIVAFKGDKGAVFPSLAVELSAKLGFDVQSAKPGLKLVQTMSAAPAIRATVEQKNGRPSKVLFSLPKDKMNLFSVHSNIKVIDANNQERPLKASDARRVEGCTSTFDKVLGIELCSRMETPKPFFNPETPFLPLNGPWALELTLSKTDRAMTGWEYTLELPSSTETELSVYRAGFNTPGSRVDRDVSAEVQLSTPRDGSQGARLRLKAPGKNIDAITSYKWDQQGVNTKADLTIDRKDKYSFEAALEKKITGKKAEWRPKLRIQVPEARPIVLGGSVTLDQGRKSQLAFDLHSDESSAQKQFFKGSFVKEGAVGVRQNFRVSSDVQGDLGVLVFRVFGMAEKQEKAMSSDMKVEYQRPNQRKHSVKLVGKLQNLSTAALNKLNSFVEVQMTQFPSKNFHLSWNVLFKPSEHVENEVSLMWSENMRDPSKKIHVLQVSKFTGLKAGGRTSTMENLVNVNIAPLRVNYEVKAGGHVENSETPKFKIDFDVVDKSKAAKNSASASFEYQHISRKPLKLAMDAMIRIPSREVIYSDKLEEVAPNEYKGKTQFQWQADKKATLDYTYRVKTDSRKTHHELDAELKTPSMKYGTHHQALLRMTPSDFEIKSKLNHEHSNLWDFQTTLSNAGRSNLALTTAQFSTKFETNPFEKTQTASLEIQGKSFPLSHISNVQIAPQMFSANSKTLYQQKPVFTLSASRSPREATRVVVDTQLFDARMESASHPSKVATFEIKSKGQSAASHHKTTFASDNQKMDIKSKTTIRGKQVANVEAILGKRSRLAVDIPQMTGNANLDWSERAQKSASLEINDKSRHNYNHKTEVTYNSNGYKATSMTKKANQAIASIEAQLSGAKSYLRTATQRYKASADFDRSMARPSAKLQLQDIQNQWEHTTDMSGDQNEWTLLSNTDRHGRQIANIDAAHNAAKSNVKVITLQGDANVEYIRGKSGKFELKSNNSPLTHRTIIVSEPSAWNIESRTEKAGRPLAVLESRLSRSERSTIRLDSGDYETKMEVDPSSRTAKTAKFLLNSKKANLVHSTSAVYRPRDQAIELLSSTEQSNRNLFNADAKLNRRAPSSIKLIADNWDAALDADVAHKKSFKIVANCKRSGLAHSTEAVYEPKQMLKVLSKTTKRSDNIYALDAQMSPIKSHLKLRTNVADAEMSARQGDANWALTTKSRQAMSHNGQVQWNKQTVTVKSATKQGSRSLLNVDGKLSRSERSHLKVDNEHLDAALEADLVSHRRSALLQGEFKRSGLIYNHALAWEPRHMASIKSQINQRGQEWYNLDGQIKHNDLSYLKIKSQDNKLDMQVQADKRSTVLVNSRPLDATFEVIPVQKSARLSIKAKNAQIQHDSSVSMDQNALNIDSKTVKRNINVAAIKSRLSRNDKSNIELQVPAYAENLSFEVNPFARNRVARLNVKHANFDHDSNVEFDADNFEFATNNKINNRNVLKVQSQLRRAGKSMMNVKTSDSDASLEYEPTRTEQTARWSLNAPRFAHKSAVVYNARKSFDVDSDTTRHGRSVLAIKSRLARNADSNLSLKSQDYELEALHQPSNRVQSAKIALIHKPQAINHVTSFAWEPRKSYEMTSSTTKSGRNVAALKSLISAHGKSNVELTFEDAAGSFEATPFEAIKSAKLILKHKPLVLSHETTVAYEPRKSLSVNSKTMRKNINVATIDANLSGQRRSHFEVIVPSHTGRVEVNPWEQVKSAKVSVKSQNGYAHITEANYLPRQSIEIKSHAKKRDQDVAKVDLKIVRNGKSYLNVNSDIADAKAHFEGRSGNVEIRGKRIPLSHESNINMVGDDATLSTSTSWDERPLFVLNSAVNRRSGLAKIDSDNKLFSGKFEVEPAARRMAAEYKCKRSHRELRATAKIPSALKFEGELQWDKSPENKIAITASAQQATRTERKTRSNVRVQYGTKTEVTIASAMDGDLLLGPHEVQIDIRAPKSQPQQFKLHHEIGNGQVQCSAKYFVNGEQKVTVENTGRYTSNKNGVDLTASFDVNSAYRYNDLDSFHASIGHKHNSRRDGFDSRTELQGKLGSQKVGATSELVFQNLRHGGKINARVAAQTPLSDFKSQEAKLVMNWDDQKIALESTATAQNKKIDAKAQVMRANGKHSVSAELTSDFKQIKNTKASAEVTLNAQRAAAQVEVQSDAKSIANVKAGFEATRGHNKMASSFKIQSDKTNIRASAEASKVSDKYSASLELNTDSKLVKSAKINASADKRSVALTADVDSKRKLSLNGNLNAQSANDFEADIDVKSAWTPRYAAQTKAKKSKDQIILEVAAKRDATELYSAKASAQKKRTGWSANAAVSVYGEELARLQADRDTSASGEESLIASARGKHFEPVKASAKLYKNEKEVRPQVEVCSGRKSECVQVSGSYKNDDSKYYKTIDRAINVVAKVQGHEARADWIIKTKDNFQNKMTVAVNGKKLGYEVIESGSTGNKKVQATLQLPQRQMIVETHQEQINRNEIRWTGTMQTDATRKPMDKMSFTVSHKDKSSRSAMNIATEVKVSHPAWPRPLSAALAVENNKANLQLDVARESSKKLTFTAQADSRSANQTFALTARRADGAIDASLEGHVAVIGSKVTNGLKWTWVDRNRRQKDGMHYFELDTAQNKVQEFLQTPAINFEGDAQFSVKNNKMQALVNSRLNGEKRQVEFALNAQQKPCAEVTVRDDRVMLGKWQGCVATEGKNVLRVTSESWENGQKETDASFVFDKRAGRVFRIQANWEPQIVGNWIGRISQMATAERTAVKGMNLQEIVNELNHKIELMTGHLDRDISRPLIQSIQHELKELARELEPLLRHLPDARQMNKAKRAVAQFAAKAADAVTPDFSIISVKMDKVIRAAAKQIKRNYPRNSAPYKVAAAYERHGLAAALRILAQAIEEQVQQGKNSVMQFSGDYANVLKNAIPAEWAKKISAAAARGSEAVMNNEFSASIGQMMADSSKASADWVNNILKSVSDELNKAIQSNKDIRGILKYIRQMIDEIRRELKHVDTKNIADLSREAIKMLATPEAWASHARVLTWNPDEGEILIELRAPVDMRQIKSVWSAPHANFTKGINTMADRLSTARAHLSKADWVGHGKSRQ